MITPACETFCRTLVADIATHTGWSYSIWVARAWTLAETGGGTAVVPATPNNYLNIGNTDSNPSGGSSWPDPVSAGHGTCQWLINNPASGASILGAAGKSDPEQLAGIYNSPFASSHYRDQDAAGNYVGPYGVRLIAAYQSLGPIPQPDPEEYMNTVDPKNGNVIYADPLGEIFVFGPQGGPPTIDGYLGGLNNHPDWHAGGAGANGPCVGISCVDDGNPTRSGYVLMCRDSAGNWHPYAFPSDGRYRS